MKPAHERKVTLDTILSCTEAPIIQEAFRTDRSTAHKLNPFHYGNKLSENEGKIAALSKVTGFLDSFVGTDEAFILPVDRASGQAIPVADLSFCNTAASMRFGDEGTSTPRSISIEGDRWVFDPNEIFAHAEQFKFDSGVFSNGSESYFTATKGRVTIQFLTSRSGLKFYRVLYAPPE